MLSYHGERRWHPFWLLLGLLQLSRCSLLVEETFASIEGTNQEQLVVFYRSLDPASKNLLVTMEKTAEKLRYDTTLSELFFRKCDGDLPENKEGFANANFDSDSFIFTSTPVEGIVKYTGPRSPKSIASLVRSKYLRHYPAHVLPFTNEFDFWDRMDLSDKPKNQFVLFTAKGCLKCDRVRRGFNIIATAYRNDIQSVEVVCESREAKDFCNQQDVTIYPAFVLFTGEEKHRMVEPEQPIVEFREYNKFLSTHMPSLKLATPGKNGRLKKKRKSKIDKMRESQKKNDGLDLGTFDISEEEL